MRLGIDFWKDVDGFLEENWRHVGINIERKSMPTLKNEFLKQNLFFLKGKQ